MEISVWIQFVVLIICLIIVAAKDYYEILGVKRDATEKEIKRQFRQLALKYHPDKNSDPKAEETFRTIVEAYDVLGNADKRRSYDTQGFHSSSSNQDGFSGFHFNMHDFFKEFDAASAKFHYDQHHAHHEAHKRAHNHGHQQAHKNAFGFDFGSLFDDDEGVETIFPSDIGGNHIHVSDVYKEVDGKQVHVHTTSETSQQTCRTVTRRQGNTVSTITECH